MIDEMMSRLLRACLLSFLLSFFLSFFPFRPTPPSSVLIGLLA